MQNQIQNITEGLYFTPLCYHSVVLVLVIKTEKNIIIIGTTQYKSDLNLCYNFNYLDLYNYVNLYTKMQETQYKSDLNLCYNFNYLDLYNYVNLYTKMQETL